MSRKEIYEEKTQREHVYIRPAAYIGSDVASMTRTWLYYAEEQRMVQQDILLITGVERLFLELLSNTYDNIIRSLQNNINKGSVEVTIHDQASITVKNYGKAISIYQDENGKWTPQKIFGSLLCGSNFNDNRQASGTNGIGAKASNIFSTYFEVKCYDPDTKIHYQQIWQNNMQDVSEPVITKGKGESYTEITYTLDIARFRKVNRNFQGYDENYVALFTRHVADLSCNAVIATSINELKFCFTSPLNYAKLFIKDTTQPIVHYQWPKELQQHIKKKKYEQTYNYWLPDIMLVMLDAPQQGACISFVNGMQTSEGGSHVNEAYKAIGLPIINKCNEEVARLIKDDNKEKRSFSVDISDVKDHVFIFLSVRLQNPNYVHQTKSKINGPAIHLTLQDNVFNVVKKWRLQDQLFLKLQEKQQLMINKSEKKKRGVRATHEKGTDANLSNNRSWNQRQKCTLAVVEGDSALCYFLELLKLIGKNARDIYGFLPLKGKSLNVMGCGVLEVEKNREMAAIRTMLGLQFGIDYNINKNVEHLRYGSLLILSDADVDGIHIAGLIINFFYCFFPALILNGYVKYWRTPVIRVRGNVTYHTGTKEVVNRKFYHQPQYEAWRDSVKEVAGNAIHYYKGLGSSEEKDIAEDYNDAKVVVYNYDDNTDQSMNLAFNKEWADERKKYISAFTNNKPIVDANTILPALSQLSISSFIQDEFILFSVENMQRSLPDLLDGCKISIRKVLYGCLKRFKVSNAAVKVATLNAYIMEKTRYHHGDAILPKIIVNLARNYISSNNINLLLPLGMFGNRYKHKAASARYIFTALNKIIHSIIRDEDKGILEDCYEEDDKVEPMRYYPIIPLLLVNGCVGIGTGHSTTIQCFNPLDLVNWISSRLNNEDVPLLLPWYRNYQGIIKVVDRKLKTIFISDYQKASKETILTSTRESNSEDKGQKLSMITEGRYHLNGNKIMITELPIDVMPYNYEKWLDELLKAGKITNYNTRSMGDTIDIEIEGLELGDNYDNNLKLLGLSSSSGMSNLTILNEQKQPVTYNSPNELMEAWYEARLPKYQIRKDYMLKVIREQIIKLTYKRDFIQAVLDKRIDITRLQEDYIRAKLIELDIPYYIYEETKIIDCSKEYRAKLQKQIEKLEADYIRIERATIQEMWLKDLADFNKAYEEFLNTKVDKEKIGVARKTKSKK